MNLWERALAKRWLQPQAGIQRLPWAEYVKAVGPDWCPGCGLPAIGPHHGAILTQCGVCDWAWLGPNGDGTGRPRG
jgi:hypothetical protein